MKLTLFRKAFTAFAAALLILGFSLRAEEGMKGRKMGEGMMKHMKEELDLSDAQVTKFKALKEADEKNNEAMRHAMEADAANLQVLVDKKAPDSELKAGVDKLKSDHKAMQAAMEKHMDDMAAILSPIQQAKAALMMMKNMRGGMMGHGMMGHGMHGDKEGKGEGHEGHEGHEGRGGSDDNDK